MTWLFLAAEAFELKPLLDRCALVRTLAWPVDYARHGELDGMRVLAVANGPGAGLAGEGMDVALGMENDVTAIVSTGVCGALAPWLRLGDIFVATEVDTGVEILPASIPPGAQPRARGRLSSSERVVGTAREKAELFEEGGLAVDMESGALIARASRRRLPFYCVRAISDTAAEDFPVDFNALRDSSGRFSRMRIARAAVGDPFRIVPALVRIRQNCRGAARALGEFLAGCRF